MKRTHEQLADKDTSLETESKKVKFSICELEKYRDVEKIKENKNLLDLNDDLMEVEDGLEDDKDEIVQEAKKNIAKHNTYDILCAYLLFDHSFTFSEKIKKCCLKLIDNTGTLHSFEDFLMDEYDYTNNIDKDFSLESFVDNNKEQCSLLLLVKEDKIEVKNKLINLLKKWLDDDIEQLSIVY